MDYLKQLFLVGPRPGQDPWPSIIPLFLLAALLVYLCLLVLLHATGLYRRPAGVARLVSPQVRIRLCAVWAVYAVMVFLTGCAIWAGYGAVQDTSGGLAEVFAALTPHAVVWMVLLLLWLGLHLSLRAASKAAQRLLP